MTVIFALLLKSFSKRKCDDIRKQEEKHKVYNAYNSIDHSERKIQDHRNDKNKQKSENLPFFLTLARKLFYYSKAPEATLATVSLTLTALWDL